MSDSAPAFSQPIDLRWSDLDPNGHVRHSVYYDWGAAIRLAYLEAMAVGWKWMSANAIGPVLFREEAKFLKELRFGDRGDVDMRMGGASIDGRKWRIRHRLLRGSEEAAVIEVDGAWLDLRARKIVTPPEELVQAFAHCPRTEDFTILPSSKTSPPK